MKFTRNGGINRMERLYNENKFLIKNRATYYAKNNSLLDRDELLAEGNLAFCRTVKEHNEDRSKFSTHLWNAVSHSMLQTIKKEKTRRKVADIENDFEKKEIEDFSIEETFSSVAAKTVVALILEKEFTHLAEVTKYLTTKMGWKHSKIQEIYREVRHDLYKDVRKKE